MPNSICVCLTHSAKNHLRLAFVILSICLLTAAAHVMLAAVWFYCPASAQTESHSAK